MISVDFSVSAVHNVMDMAEYHRESELKCYKCRHRFMQWLSGHLLVCLENPEKRD